MSTSYRISRNIEASLIDYLNDALEAGGWSVNVEKTFARVYSISLPSICVRVSDTIHEFVEIGDTATVRSPLVFIDIFATSDGQRLDLKDFLIEKLKDTITSVSYTHLTLPTN